MKLFLCVAFAFVVVRADPDNCDVSADRRVNCGAFDEADCEKRNCCYDSGATDTYKCFHPKDPCEMPNPCLYGAECVNKPNHANFDDGAYDCICPASKPPGTDCRSRQGNCNVEPADRIACGLVKIFEKLLPNYDPATVCESRGCCYNDKTKREEWCFHPGIEKDLPQCVCETYDEL